ASPTLMARPREMTDAQMDKVSGGTVSVVNAGTGPVTSTITDNSVQSINLSDQAQQNLTSLVNILSINSTIQVMLNLNVNINSTVGSVTQSSTGAANAIR